MDHTKELTHISLCAGYGGIDLGLRRVIPSIRTIAFSEIEAYAVANLVSKIEAGHLDAAPIWSNLKTFPWSSFRGKVDIISGGFPCQPFSSAGRRQGDEDPRHLWPFIVRGLRDASPSICFFENVEGIISSKLGGNDWSDPKGSPVLLHVLRELERLGYRATAGIFSASEIGAPHQRKRVFILGAKLADSQSERLQRIFSEKESGKPCDGNARQSELADSLFKSTLYPSRRGQAQYSWEPPRLLVDDLCERLSKRERESDINRISSREDQKQSTAFNPGASNINNESERQIKPSMGGCLNGSTDRLDDGELYESYNNITDELRLLGNGVVPDTAARAFEVLWSRLGNADKYATRNESKDNVEKINQTDQARKTTILDTAASASGS